jgi:hypothetical protein
MHADMNGRAVPKNSGQNGYWRKSVSRLQRDACGTVIYA